MAREKLTRGEQRFNYAVAVAVGAVFVVLIVVSVSATIAVLVAAFLFGLGQMVLGLTRRRRFLKGIEAGGLPGARDG